MQNSKFYYSGNQPVILKGLVYQIECGRKFLSDGTTYAYTITFCLFDRDPVQWMFETEDVRDRAYGNVLDASMNQ